MSTKWVHRGKKYLALYPIPYFISFGKPLFKKPWSFPKHQHMNYEIIFVIKGSELVSINDEPFLCKANELFIVEPGSFHEEKLLTHPLEFFCLGFSYKDQLGKDIYLFKKGTASKEKHILNCSKDIKHIFLSIYKEVLNKKYRYVETVESLIIQLINNILREFKTPILSADETLDEKTRLIERIKMYITGDITRNLSLESIAKEHYISPSYLSHNFKRITGLSPISYIVHTRIEAAKKLLLLEGSSVKDVSAKVGFQDPYYFSKMFKKITGKSPESAKKYISFAR